MDKIYIIMWHNELFETRFYVNEDEISKRVDTLNNFNVLGAYWYQTLKIKN